MHRVAPDPALVSTAKDALAASPGWARVGLTFGNEALREQALTVLAASVVARLQNPPAAHDPDQLPLAL